MFQRIYYCDGCGAKIEFSDEVESLTTLFAISLREQVGMRPQQLHNHDLCERCGNLLLTLIHNKGLYRALMGDLKAEDILGAIRDAPIPMILTCPQCGARHIDEGAFATRPHHTHACQTCGMVWRPTIAYTVGVQFLPNFKTPEPDPAK